MYTQKEVLDYVNEEDVKFVRLAFFDLNGVKKNISIMAGQLERAFRNGVSFDASAIYGFESPEKSDLFLYPDPATLCVLPWRPNTGKVVRMFCSIKYADGRDYERDCRTLLKNTVRRAREECGVDFFVGTEIEFYLFKLDENGEPTKNPFDNAGYMDIAPEDKGENIRREICFTLEQMGIRPESSHHEEGPGQNEIDFHHADAVTAADNAATFKWVVRTRAALAGLYADFSPKPLDDKAGSGLHINISCSDSSKNRYAMAGILAHAEEMTYYLNCKEDSYDRLGEHKAPKYICWGEENRLAFIRVPAVTSEASRRMEIRSPDCHCNIYLVLNLLINAAVDGIKNKLEPPPMVPAGFSPDKFADDKAGKSALRMLPDTLEAARKIAQSSDFVRKALGF